MNINILKAKKLFSLDYLVFFNCRARHSFLLKPIIQSECYHLVHCHRTTVVDHWIYDAFRIISYFIFRIINHNLAL